MRERAAVCVCVQVCVGVGVSASVCVRVLARVTVSYQPISINTVQRLLCFGRLI